MLINYIPAGELTPTTNIIVFIVNEVLQLVNLYGGYWASNS